MILCSVYNYYVEDPYYATVYILFLHEVSYIRNELNYNLKEVLIEVNKYSVRLRTVQVVLARTLLTTSYQVYL